LEGDDLSEDEQNFEEDQLQSNHLAEAVSPTAIITLCASDITTNHSTLKFQGKIGSLDIIAMVDSGSTHSFSHPSIVHLLHLPTIHSPLLSITTATGVKLDTNQLCTKLKF
jgi:hypothetical protein